jgi:hypothetical protein
VSKDLFRLLVLFRRDRQYYSTLIFYNHYNNEIIISVPIAKSAEKLARVLFSIALRTVRFGFYFLLIGAVRGTRRMLFRKKSRRSRSKLLNIRNIGPVVLLQSYIVMYNNYY